MIWAGLWGKEYVVCLRTTKKSSLLGICLEGHWGRRLEREDGARTWRFLNREELGFDSISNLARKETCSYLHFARFTFCSCVKRNGLGQWNTTQVWEKCENNSNYEYILLSPHCVPSIGICTLLTVIHTVVLNDRHYFLQLLDEKLSFIGWVIFSIPHCSRMSDRLEIWIQVYLQNKRYFYWTGISSFFTKKLESTRYTNDWHSLWVKGLGDILILLNVSNLTNLEEHL